MVLNSGTIVGLLLLDLNAILSQVLAIALIGICHEHVVGLLGGLDRRNCFGVRSHGLSSLGAHAPKMRSRTAEGTVGRLLDGTVFLRMALPATTDDSDTKVTHFDCGTLEGYLH